MKICSKCNKEKSLDEYLFINPKKQDGKLRPDCRSCVRSRASAYYAKDPKTQRTRMELVKKSAVFKAKQFRTEYLSGKSCVDCGEQDPIVLDFDHIANNKVCDVSKMVSRGYRLWRIEQEISKCEIRCANCHRRITYKRSHADVV